jgi:hypothetical protein
VVTTRSKVPALPPTPGVRNPNANVASFRERDSNIFKFEAPKLLQLNDQHKLELPPEARATKPQVKHEVPNGISWNYDAFWWEGA